MFWCTFKKAKPFNLLCSIEDQFSVFLVFKKSVSLSDNEKYLGRKNIYEIFMTIARTIK